jgi:hypothetical protein
MGLTPITNLTPLPLFGPIQEDFEPQPMERVESSARTGDETYSPSDGRSASGSAGDDSDEYFDDDVFGFEDMSEMDSISASNEANPSQQISLFA